jgi:hypothetical protein
MAEITQHFEGAVRVLVGDGAVKQRLLGAYESFLADLVAGELPAHLRPVFDELHRAFHRVEPTTGGETAVRASVRKMSSSDAGAHAESIVQLYVALLTQAERAEPLKVVPRPTAPPTSLPRYVARRR